jgi:hypothetical protein
MQQVFGASQRSVASAKKRGREKTEGRSGAAADGQRLEQLLTKVGALDADQPHRRRAFARVLVEAVLTEEFGATVASEAAFQEVIDDVAMAIEGSAGLQRDLDRIISQCTSPAG